MKRLALAITAALMLVAAVIAQAADVTVGQSGWNWGNPQPQGQPLHAVEFAGGRGYAAGAFGTLLRTDDGGASWTGIATGTTADLSRLRVIDPNTVVIGSGCLLRRSDDGGASFRRLLFTSSETSCSATIASFHFPSAQIGYLLLSDGTVVQTANGGGSFSGRQAVPGTQATRPSGTAATPTDIFFTDPNTGFAITRGPDGGSIYRTSDGGNTWFKQGSSTRALSSVFFASPMVGYAVGAGDTVLKTADGGMTWDAKPVADDVPPDDLTQIRCATPMSCLISTASGDQVLRTTDGGTTITSFNPSARKIAAISFASPSVAVGVGERGATVRTNADAATPSFTPVGTEPLDGTFSRLRASSDSVVHAPGENGRLALSVDGGRHWGAVHVPTSDNLLDAWFVDATHGFVLDVNGKAQRTDDGGASWALLDTGTPAKPNAIYAPDTSTVLLFGPVGVSRSQDGGNSFEPIASGPARTATLEDYDRTSGGVLFAYGPDRLLESSTLGASWKRVKGPPVLNPQYQKVDFVTETTGFALTGSGQVWKTVNGGRKWTELTATGTSHPYDMSFADANNGFLAVRSFGTALGADAGWVLHTADGGATWRPELIEGTPLAERGLAAPVAGTAFALAGASDLFYTNSGGEKGNRTTLTIAAQPRTVGRKQRTVKITGKLAPAVSGATVVVSARRLGSTTWRLVDTPKVSSTGTFTTSIRVRTSTVVVAQWAGDAAHDGDGSQAIQILRKLPKKKR